MLETLLPVVILAGGLATRLRPLTVTMPKSLIRINNEPFIAHQLRLLRKNNIKRVVISIGFLGEQIIDFVGDGHAFDLEVTYASDGPALLGTAGAIKHALPLLDDAFFVLYGDSYLPCDYLAIQKHFMHCDKLALMSVFQNQGMWDKSNVEYDKNQIVVYDKINRNTNMHHIDYGLGLFKKSAFEYVPADENYDLADLYKQLLAIRELSAYEVNRRFYETGSFIGIKELEHYLISCESI